MCCYPLFKHVRKTKNIVCRLSQIIRNAETVNEALFPFFHADLGLAEHSKASCAVKSSSIHTQFFLASSSQPVLVCLCAYDLIYDVFIYMIF